VGLGGGDLGNDGVAVLAQDGCRHDQVEVRPAFRFLGRLTQRRLKQRAVPSGSVLNSRTPFQQKHGADPRRACI